jgi:hypothetical protein
MQLSPHGTLFRQILQQASLVPPVAQPVRLQFSASALSCPPAVDAVGCWDVIRYWSLTTSMRTVPLATNGVMSEFGRSGFACLV